MQATRITVVRHGETTWNKDTRIQGHIDIDLNDTGRWQAERLGHALADDKLDAIYASDLRRAFTTAQAISRHHGLEVRPEPQLRERGFGQLEGLTWAEIEAQHPDDARAWRSRVPDWSPHGGETLHILQSRIGATLNRLASAHLGEHIALVAHGGVLDIIYRLAAGVDLQAPRTWQLKNAAINRVLWTPDSLTLVGWGDVAHLEAPASGPALDEKTV